MSRISFVKVVAFLALIASSRVSLAATTYAVGTCKPTLHSFSTISAALSAVPSPNVVLVCPGTYPEQIEINFPVTVEGVISGNAAQAIVVPPRNGLVANASDDFGDSLAAQLFVNNVAGPVNVSDLTFDAQGKGAGTPTWTVGIFYQNSPGTVKEVTTRNQSNIPGLGIYIEGGPANPTVTVENSSVHEFADLGIDAETNSSTSQLTATIKGNYVNGGSGGTTGIQIAQGITATVSGNYLINNGSYGITDFGAIAGSVSGNTLVNNWIGVFAESDGVSVTSNKIFESFWAVEIGGGNATIQGIPAIQNNTIVESAVGVEFNCISNPNVHSNTISDGATGLDHVPGAIVSPNSYFNTVTVRTGGC